MGFFSSLLGSDTHSQSTSSVTGATSNTQLAGGNIGAPVNWGSGRQTVNISTTDGGTLATAYRLASASDALAAIGVTTGANLASNLGSQALGASVDISSAASSLGRYALASGNSVAIAGLDNARLADQGSLRFAQSALSTTADANNHALGAAIDFAHSALGSQSDLAKTAVGAVQDSTQGVLDFAAHLFDTALGSQTQLTNQNTEAVSGLAAQVSQSAQQSTNDSTQKVVLYVACAVAAVFIFKGGIK